MSVAGDHDVPTKDELRARERDAIVALAVDSLPNRDQIRRQLLEFHHHALPSLPDALRYLAGITDAGRRISQRTFSLQLLVKYARRRGYDALVHDAGDHLTTFLAAAVDEANRPPGTGVTEMRRIPNLFPAIKAPDQEPRHLADAVAAPVIDVLPPGGPTLAFTGGEDDDGVPRSAPGAEPPVPPPAPPGPPPADAGDPLDPVAAVNASLQASAELNTTDEPWTVFAAGAQEHLHLTDLEVQLPQCSDEEQVEVGSGAVGTRTIVQFTSGLDAADFDHWTDPRRWHLDCSLFFKSLTTKQNLPATQDEFQGVLFEEVVAMDGDPANDMVTPLLFSRRVRQDFRQCRFILPPNTTTPKLTVDEGILRARTDPNEPDPARRTTLTAEKIIKFVDPALQDWPTHLCDLWWMELTITVALGCAQAGY